MVSRSIGIASSFGLGRILGDGLVFAISTISGDVSGHSDPSASPSALWSIRHRKGKILKSCEMAYGYI